MVLANPTAVRMTDTCAHTCFPCVFVCRSKTPVPCCVGWWLRKTTSGDTRASPVFVRRSKTPVPCCVGWWLRKTTSGGSS